MKGNITETLSSKLDAFEGQSQCSLPVYSDFSTLDSFMAGCQLTLVPLLTFSTKYVPQSWWGLFILLWINYLIRVSLNLNNKMSKILLIWIKTINCNHLSTFVSYLFCVVIDFELAKLELFRPDLLTSRFDIGHIVSTRVTELTVVHCPEYPPLDILSTPGPILKS